MNRTGLSLLLLFLTLGLTNLTHAGGTMKSDENAKMDIALFAGGCFWCMEPPFEKLPGVTAVISGYTGGMEVNPDYQQVAGGKTGHTEAIQVIYDPKVVDYNTLLNTFWANIDPTDGNGQFVDRGRQYRSGIFYLNDQQRRLAESSKEKLAATGLFKKPIVTEITAAGPFYPAEDYHQDYYKTNPIRYNYYRWGSGRDDFLESTWKQEKKSP